MGDDSKLIIILMAEMPAREKDAGYFPRIYRRSNYYIPASSLYISTWEVVESIHLFSYYLSFTYLTSKE
ncbi:MAG: hypothetical protein V5A68_03630 [Candidatus Thermoplasmatota archaeon]